MKLATIRTDDGLRAVRVDAEYAVETGYDDLRSLLDATDWRDLAAGADGPIHDLAGVDYAPLVPSPEKIICVGKNYADHIAEMGGGTPDRPTLFTKFARSLIGAHDPLVLPEESAMVDWEAELCIVIGAITRRADATEAAAAIAGYTVMNDVSMRDWQRHTDQFTAGKIWEASTPVGPVMTVTDADDGPPHWDIGCEIDGVTMQSSNTRQLVFDPVELIEYISTVITLVPGDLIATGTPGGVGAGRRPPEFLRPGQEVVVYVDQVGACRNRTVAR